MASITSSSYVTPPAEEVNSCHSLETEPMCNVNTFDPDAVSCLHFVAQGCVYSNYLRVDSSSLHETQKPPRYLVLVFIQS